MEQHPHQNQLQHQHQYQHQEQDQPRQQNHQQIQLQLQSQSQSQSQPQPQPQHRVRQSSSNFSLAFPRSASLLGHGVQLKPSRTWTPSSGGFGLLSDADDIQDRSIFVMEYNRLAGKHGVRNLNFDGFGSPQDAARSPEKRSWFHRLFRGSIVQQMPAKAASIPRPRYRRSVSDLGHFMHYRREPPRQLELQTMVRLSGKSVLYLPLDYAPCSLILPTCFRATAQYIAQHASTRGIFRIPGSVKVVNSLFDYYCYTGGDGVDVAGTVCCATLPTHIQYSVHDVASTFKRLLSCLPGGILGSLTVFDAFSAIHARLQGEPEFPRTKQTKVRARLIALAIGTIESQFRRELICAVFGLLSLIGRVAEVSPREDADGRPLPTADLIGYNALGIVFGPLLMGDLLERYTPMQQPAPPSGLQFPLSPRRLCRERQKHKSDETSAEPPPVNRILVANDIAEMLITNWRDVVRQMRSLGIHYRRESSSARLHHAHSHPSNSESFIIKMPPELKEARSMESRPVAGQDNSPDPDTPTRALSRRRSRPVRREFSGNHLQKSQSFTAAESHVGMRRGSSHPIEHHHNPNFEPFDSGHGHSTGARNTHHGRGYTGSPFPLRTQADRNLDPNAVRAQGIGPSQGSRQEWSGNRPAVQVSPVSIQQIPPRGSSKRGLSTKPTMTSPILSPSGDGDSLLHARTRDSCATLIRDTREGQSLEPSFLTGQETIRSKGSFESHQQTMQPESSRLDEVDEIPHGGHHGSDIFHFPSNPEYKHESDLKGTPWPSHPHGAGLHLDQAAAAGDKYQMAGALDPSSARSGFQNWPLRVLDRGNTGPESEALEAPSSPHTASITGVTYTHASAEPLRPHDTAPGHDPHHDRNASETQSENSNDSQAPIKRRSVRAMAAMFESQQLLQRLNNHRQPPPGGVDLSPIRRQSKEPLEHSHSLPILASRDADGPGWARSAEPEGYKSTADTKHLQEQTAMRAQLEAFDGDHDCLEQVDRCTSACALRSLDLKHQIVNLERLLSSKSDEVEKLKRRLEMVGKGGSPNEQLRRANDELSVLKEKAEATEKKMRLFERFTAKLRGIRDSMLTDSSRQSSINRPPEHVADGDRHVGGHQGTDVQFPQRVRFAEGLGVGADGRDSDDSGMMEDEAVVPARIRNCLHYEGGERGVKYLGLDGQAGTGVQGVQGAQGAQGGRHHDDDVGGLAQVWSAVEELLKMDDQTFLRDWSPVGSKGRGVRHPGAGA